MNQVLQGQSAQEQTQPTVRLLRPEHIRNISYLNATEKAKYEEGLRGLWQKVEQFGSDTQEHVLAKSRIEQFSKMVFQKIKTLQAQGPAQAMQSQANRQPQPGQPGVAAQGQHNRQVPAGAAAISAPKNPMAANHPQGQPGGSNAANAHILGGSASNQIPKHFMDHVNKLPWGALITPEQPPKWLGETKQKYLRCLMTMDQIKTRILKSDAVIKERQEKGPPLQPEEQKKLMEQKATDQRNFAEAEKYVKGIRNQMTMNANNGQTARAIQLPNAGAAAPNHPMVAATASISTAMQSAKDQQLSGLNRNGSVGQAHAPQRPATPATPTTGAPQQPGHAATAPRPQVKTEPGSQIPPVNTALAAAASSANLASAGTPTQASARVQTPQSATQPTPTTAAVPPLTHAAAVHRANSSSNVTVQPSTVPATGATPTPNTGTLMGNATQPPHNHAHPPQPNPALTQKMPIQKNLPDKATQPPTPVTVGGGTQPGRPSYGGGNATGGVINQPVIAKMPTVQFEVDGEHVLSKKKLDELVRQVCGGGSPGVDGNYLTADVEESVLNIADNFVDNVIQTACRLAKERGSKVLEIRDIQLVLERVYNIRIPGYTSDELRTVRKVQPSANWIAKMSAVQAAKVMPGKDDK